MSQSYVAVCSDSKTHNAGAIYTFIGRLVAILKRLEPHLAHIHFISNSLALQYRNKTMVQVVHRFQECFGPTASWTWLESGHGKGPCDGVGGGVKRKVSNLAKGGAIIRGADEFYQVFNPARGKVKLINVDAKEVSLGVRKVYAWKAPLVKGLSKMHALVCTEFVCLLSCIHDMRCLLVAVGLNSRFIVLYRNRSMRSLQLLILISRYLPSGLKQLAKKEEVSFWQNSCLELKEEVSAFLYRYEVPGRLLQ